MDWGDERYARLYTRDTADWLALSFEAQSLLCLILRKLDRAGVLDLGRHGKRAVAIAVGHASRWDVLEPALDELLNDGCVVLDGGRLVMPNFLEAQEAVQSDRLRQRESRARRRQLQGGVTKRDSESRAVTESHGESRDVTSSHDESQDVTPCRTVPCLTVHAPSEQGDQTVLISVAPVPRFDFAGVYARYPRKLGKAAGMESCAKLIRTAGDFEALSRGVDAFAAEVKRLGTPADKIPYWSSWVNARRWMDYGDEAGAAPSKRSLVDRMAAGEIQ